MLWGKRFMSYVRPIHPSTYFSIKNNECCLDSRCFLGTEPLIISSKNFITKKQTWPGSVLMIFKYQAKWRVNVRFGFGQWHLLPYCGYARLGLSLAEVVLMFLLAPPPPPPAFINSTTPHTPYELCIVCCPRQNLYQVSYFYPLVSYLSPFNLSEQRKAGTPETKMGSIDNFN